MRATVITDASFCHKTLASGWAAWITLDTKERIQKSGTFRDHPTSNTHAEQLAMFNAVTLAYLKGARDVLVQSDCLAVVKHSPAFRPRFEEVRLKHFPDCQVQFRWVPGHAGTDEPRLFAQDWCDRESRAIMRE